MYRLYGVESEFLSPTAVKARLPILRTEDLLVSDLLLWLRPTSSLIWLIVSKIWKIHFFMFGLKLPNHAHFWFFCGILIPEQFFLIETLKRHILGWSHVIWGIDCENPSTPFAVGDNRKKGKVRDGKVSHNLGLYFSYVGSGPPWTDFYENWQG